MPMDSGFFKMDTSDNPPATPLSSHSMSKESVANMSATRDSPAVVTNPPDTVYRLYKRRFAGVVGMVALNVVAALSWPWFGPISNKMVDEFGFTLDEVNWLGNIVACVYMPVAIAIPTLVSRYGVRRCCDIGAIALIISAWVRYAGTAQGLSKRDAYVLIIMGQFFSAVAQPMFQVLGPKYSELWFNLDGRTTATAIISISNPIGGAVGQLLSPLVGNTRTSILVLGIASTTVTPFVFFIGKAPPTPPTYAGSQNSQSLLSLCRAMIGKPTKEAAFMTSRQRIDFALVTLIFGVLVAATNTFAILSAQILQPEGYSEDTSGFMGACLLLTGIVAAIVTGPLFDRIFTHHLARTTKVLVPIVGLTWLSLVWAVRPNNTAPLFVVMTILGVCSVTMLPVGLELGCELTRNADGSSAVLWFAGNLFGVVFVLCQNALRAGLEAKPPLNMNRALIFNGTIVLATTMLSFLMKGKQYRKELDEQMNERSMELVGLPTEATPRAQPIQWS